MDEEACSHCEPCATAANVETLLRGVDLPALDHKKAKHGAEGPVHSAQNENNSAVPELHVSDIHTEHIEIHVKETQYHRWMFLSTSRRNLCTPGHLLESI